MELKKNDLVPGQRVSMEHFQYALPIHLYHSKGRTDANDMFNRGCIFVDNISGYVHVWNQIKFSADETVKDKLLYERDAVNYGILIQVYNIDNGVFTSKYLMNALIEKDQHTRFSGAGAAHQNGVSKRVIQTVFRMARTMLIHSATPRGQ